MQWRIIKVTVSSSKKQHLMGAILKSDAIIRGSKIKWRIEFKRSTFSHLKLLDPFQPVQIRHQSDSIFQCPEKLHLELHHLPEVTE